ncbi:hypothetical protein tb265_49440 [Gemmatimonadetes bacterium T265]|nr:hypothetical protein tb265_49440 [Gemmatimonadetes bacterium T265]
MTTHSTSRRTFLVAATALAATPVLAAATSATPSAGAAADPSVDPADDAAVAAAFLRHWDDAWNRHDAHALARLHTADAVTVNRFGTVVTGRDALEHALGFLHGARGPFHAVTCPPLHLLDVRRLAPDVLVLHARWQNPVMHPDGTIDPTTLDDMIVSYTLRRSGTGWQAAEVDLHNVEPIDLPFAHAGQRP